MPPFLSIPEWSGLPRLLHGFGTRGLSEAALEILARDNGAAVVMLDQFHSADVLSLDRVPSERKRGDALVTDSPGLLLVVKTADCLPLFLFDEVRRIAAAVHAGWRGTAGMIARAAVESMGRRFGSRPEALTAAFGPCIGPSCYEVGEDVVRAFARGGPPGSIFNPIPEKPGRFHLDLRAANRAQLEGAGVLSRRIFSVAVCTHCEPGLLSWRRDRDSAARLYNFIGLTV